jgi:hypothetical protein
MAWTAPLTAVDGSTLSAGQFNESIRDNLNETMPGKATAAGSLFITTGVNALAERRPSGAVVAASEQTSSGSFSDLSTVGPRVTVVTGTSALVWITASVRNVSHPGRGAYASVAVSGATTLPATTARQIGVNGIEESNPQRMSGSCRITGLTPGSNTFTLQYRCEPSYGPAQFEDREITVIPL